MSWVAGSFNKKFDEIAPRQGIKHSKADALRAFATQYQTILDIFIRNLTKSPRDKKHSKADALRAFATQYRDDFRRIYRPIG
jgi:hypothetical protein